MDPIAIIGIGCRFPRAEGPREFWRLLRDGRDAVSEVPASRWSIDELYDPAPQTPGKMNSRYGGFLEQVDRFDPQFFGISPREAVRMDPQQRLALEVAWEALEDAGLPAPRLAGSAAGVFLGFGVPEYFIDQVREPRLPPLIRYLTRGWGTREARSPDVLSLVLFQPDYVQRLIELGEADAEGQADRVEAFLSAPGGSAALASSMA